MDKIQDRVVALIKEIHELCEENDIEYFLSDRMKSAALVNHRLEKNIVFGDLLMTPENLKKFIDVFNSNPKKNRKIESLLCNESFPGYFVNYVDTDTVHYTMFRLACEKHLGMYVQINAIRPRTITTPFFIALEQTWNKISYGGNVVGKKLGPIIEKKLRKKIARKGQKQTAEDLFNYLTKKYSHKKSEKSYWVKRGNRNLLLDYDNHAFENKEKIEIDGFEFYCFSQGNEYIRKNILKEKEITAFQNSEMNFVDTDISYMNLDFEQYKKDIKQIFANTRNLQVKSKYLLKIKKNFFKVLIRTHARFYYGKLLNSRIDELEQLLEQGREDELETIMNPYVFDLMRYKNIYLCERINAILERHYKIDLGLVFNNIPNFYKKGIQIFDFNGKKIDTIMGNNND